MLARRSGDVFSGNNAGMMQFPVRYPTLSGYKN